MKRDLLLSTLAAVAAIVTLSLAASCTKTNLETDPEAPENGEENSYLLRYTAPEETVPDEWAGYRHGFDAATGEGWIELSSDVTEIPEEAFWGTGLTSIEIPASVTEIKDGAFEYCEDLRSVTFAVGSQLKTIGAFAFGNSGLTTIKIPESVRYIGEEAFYYSRYLETVIFLSSVPPFHGEDVFGGCVSLEAIYVPDGSMDAYCVLWPEDAYVIFEERLRQKEINMTVSEVTDNTAVVNCVFTPTKSSTYQVRIGGTVSEEFSESVRLRISNLASGENHRITATVFDTNHNQIGTEDLDFMTTGIPTGTTQEDAVIERIDDPLLVTLTVSSDSNGKAWIGDDESVTSGQFQFGQQVVIHAAPNDGFSFLKWNDDNLQQSRTVTVGPADTEYSAAFISSDSVLKSFTVNSQGKKVAFSKGNLWADNSNDLHFENNQWEFSARYDREHVSYFTWSSTISDATGMYGTGGNLFCDEDHKQSVDGSEAIYYALSIEEWQYLFDTHDCRWVEVNGVGGYLVAPDGVTLSARKVGYTENELKEDNLVFFPAMGCRADSSTFFVGIFGLYWSSTEVEDYPGLASYYMGFDLYDEVFPEDDPNYWGGSIRLVSDCQ